MNLMLGLTGGHTMERSLVAPPPTAQAILRTPWTTKCPGSLNNPRLGFLRMPFAPKGLQGMVGVGGGPTQNGFPLRETSAMEPRPKGGATGTPPGQPLPTNNNTDFKKYWCSLISLDFLVMNELLLKWGSGTDLFNQICLGTSFVFMDF